MSRDLENIYESILSKIGELPLEGLLNSLNIEHTDRQEIYNEFQGLGPIKNLLNDPHITEICINNYDLIYIERAGCLEKTNKKFYSSVTYKIFIQNLLIEIGKVADSRHPLVDGTLGCGARVHVALHPISSVPVVTIRKHRATHFTLQDLVNLKMLSQSFYSQLKEYICNKKNILICGATNSGKTTLLKALLKEINDSERIITLEDTPEIGKINNQHISLVTRSDPEDMSPSIDLSLLLKNSLRMRPDRVVVGEVRSEEAIVLLDALATGHRGSICTLHAQSVEHGLKRLESLVLRAAPQWSLMAVRQLIKDSIDVVVVCKKENGLRFISQAALISSIENFGYLTDPLI